MTTRVDGARILIAGATGGLGAPLTRLLAERGARLTLVSRSADRLKALAGEIRPTPATQALDLTDEGAPALAVRVAVDAHGGLDGVVFAAGVVAFGPVAELQDSTLETLLRTNVVAPVQLLRSAYPFLLESAGSGRSPFLVNLSAVVAEQPMAGMAAYSASKAARTAFDAAAARELRRARIRLLDVRPPHAETGLATRPIAGVTPTLAPGRQPGEVVARILRAIESDERDLASSAFEE
ncbi:MAG TPA: SDR family NAD(P)-dependent oxidoreductase [Kineosporiaceae bacterium]|nr:SDR family NAD(P)-dependent oxidoreductase [Kineosporiaceae bacterium]